MGNKAPCRGAGPLFSTASDDSAPGEAPTWARCTANHAEQGSIGRLRRHRRPCGRTPPCFAITGAQSALRGPSRCYPQRPRPTSSEVSGVFGPAAAGGGFSAGVPQGGHVPLISEAQGVFGPAAADQEHASLLGEGYTWVRPAEGRRRRRSEGLRRPEGPCRFAASAGPRSGFRSPPEAGPNLQPNIRTSMRG